MTMSGYDTNNIFAKILRKELPCHNVYETDDVLAFMDIMPRENGHVLVLPKVDARTLLDVPRESLAPLIEAVQLIAKSVMRAFGADGVTVQQFNENAGGQVVFHLHFHIIPRFEGRPLKPHTGAMEQPEILAENAEKLRQAVKENIAKM